MGTSKRKGGMDWSDQTMSHNALVVVVQKDTREPLVSEGLPKA